MHAAGGVDESFTFAWVALHFVMWFFTHITVLQFAVHINRSPDRRTWKGIPLPTQALRHPCNDYPPAWSPYGTAAFIERRGLAPRRNRRRRTHHPSPPNTPSAAARRSCYYILLGIKLLLVAHVFARNFYRTARIAARQCPDRWFGARHRLPHACCWRCRRKPLARVSR